ncbi:hypothetical protein L208DRAFT_1389187 [Tricholoma matsutake]|nr:hypothetical protein L208DRAFT_1389187 [Tricholoma matsutake 945]
MSIGAWILFSLRELWALAVSYTTSTWNRKSGDHFMWAPYNNILQMRCLSAMPKSSPPHSADRFEGDCIAERSYIPQEVAEIIISYLAGDSRSLRKCSLVCKSWVHPSRIHLFKNIVLNFYEPLRPGLGQYHNPFRSITRKSTALLRCLDRSPHLAWYFLSLEIRNCWCVNSSSKSLKEVLHILVRLLPKLRHVTRFVLRNSHWESLSDKEVRRSISTLLALPTLKHINLDTLTLLTYKDLADLLSVSAQLSTLVLNDVTCIKALPTDDVSKCHWNRISAAQSVDLQELQIDSPGLSPHLDWLCSSQSPFNVGNIQRLHVSARSLSRNAVTHLLHNSCKTLDLLELGPTLTSDLGLHMNLGMMANIRSLTLRLVTIDASSATAFFRPLDASQVYALEEVTIELLSPALIWRDWSELDASLSQPELAQLRRIEIQVPAGIWRWTNPNFEKFRAQFPAMEERGILRIRTD